MIVVHHLNESRSQRILWLLEELKLPYEIKFYSRDAVTRLAPPELKAIHPLGKSPVVTVGTDTVIESGSIIDYIIRRHADGRMAPDPASHDYDVYQQWLHYAEGSAMLPLMLNMYVARLGEGGAALHPRIESEISNHLGYVEGALAGRDYLMGDSLTGADVQMSFVPEVAKAMGKLPSYPNMAAWIERLHARPAWAAALAKGGEYLLGR
ncbi:MAG: glutathione S-transferase [Caulobacter sp.]|jgi:glutathione S-transferase|nr:glutathione S-transferase [Caulobacter sp.]